MDGGVEKVDVLKDHAPRELSTLNFRNGVPHSRIAARELRRREDRRRAPIASDW
jgi:hypothetical protein